MFDIAMIARNALRGLNALNSDLLKRPIRVPANPFWDVFKRFGRDEMIAMVLNVLGTAAMTWLVGVVGIGIAARSIILSLVGPVVEKFGFFPGHFRDAFEFYRTTPPEKRQKLSKYFKDATKGGSISLLEDILIHDPLYILFMFAGMNLYPETPPWLLATVSFVMAVFVVAGGEVAVNEIRYALRRLWLWKIGFEKEKYYECRFFISAEKKSIEVLERMTKKFNLTVKEKGTYEDHYYETRLPGYSGRDVKFRMRYRTVGDKEVNTIQVVYRRAAEIAKSEVGQFRFFPQEKHKYYLDPGRIRQGSKDLKDITKQYLAVGKMCVKGTERVIRFKRTIARDYPNGLFVSIDDIDAGRPFFLVELKVYKDLKLLKRGMRFIMTEFPVVQTTYGKEEMI